MQILRHEEVAFPLVMSCVIHIEILIMSFRLCHAGISGSEMWFILNQSCISCFLWLLSGVCVLQDMLCKPIIWFLREHHIRYHFDA